MTPDEIMKLEAGPEIDALVAKALGLVVLGIVPCEFDPEWDGIEVPWRVLRDGDISVSSPTLRPIVSEPFIPPLSNTLSEYRVEAAKNYNHLSFRSVPDYSTKIMGAFVAEEAIKAKSAAIWQRYGLHVYRLVVKSLGLDQTSQADIIHATPLQRCQAILLTLAQA